MIIDDEKLQRTLENAKSHTDTEVTEILTKARELKGLSLQEAAVLLNITDEKLLQELFHAAKYVKEEIYGNRIVLFAPLYISNICTNECVYCAFRKSNTSLKRHASSREEITQEVTALLQQGHKRILMVAGEAYPGGGLQYVYDSIKAIYDTRWNGQNIRRVNVNIAPLVQEEFEELKKCNIGTYQLFQETYHKQTYEQLHLEGAKKDYQFRLDAMDRALKAGINDVGIGPLLGLYDYKYEILATLEHAFYLDQTYGVGPHTISIPRIEPAEGSDYSLHPPYQLTDMDFKKVVAVLRLAVPYTGIILSTRESAQMRNECMELGVSQISAASRVNPGGYSYDKDNGSQFTLTDERTLAEVIDALADAKHMPSFCTGCYRLGRVGKDFMDLAKPGLIKKHCLPNAMFTFAEYLEDFAPEALKTKGYALIESTTQENFEEGGAIRKMIETNLANIKNGKRDLYF
ncbi:MAG: [Elusimicrobiaceae bacterium]|nr:[FeFe] hydrogenase H-cluster radical SAM maturase HydG [Elusimicrobiaceae bacterium]